MASKALCLFIVLLASTTCFSAGEVRPSNGIPAQQKDFGLGAPPGVNGFWWESCQTPFSHWTDPTCGDNVRQDALMTACRDNHGNVDTTSICWARCPGGRIYVDNGVFMCG